DVAQADARRMAGNDLQDGERPHESLHVLGANRLGEMRCRHRLQSITIYSIEYSQRPCRVGPGRRPPPLPRDGDARYIAASGAGMRLHSGGRTERRPTLSFSTLFARGVALVGGAALQMRRLASGSPEPAWGSAPTIPAGRPQGAIPTLKMPTARGWREGHTPVAAPGLKVNAFAGGLDHPRWIEVLPNGDVLIAEAMSHDRPARSVFDYAMISTMRRADAMGKSANRITLLRDSDGDGVAEIREVFLKDQNQP